MPEDGNCRQSVVASVMRDLIRSSLTLSKLLSGLAIVQRVTARIAVPYPVEISESEVLFRRHNVPEVARGRRKVTAAA